MPKMVVGCKCFLIAVVCCAAIACGKNPASAEEGKRLFNRHCQVCHPGGKNIVNPARSLFVQDLKKNGIETPEAVVNIIRKAPPGMPSFDVKVLPDGDAQAIARYILETFK